MNRPTLEVADILRASGSSFLDRHGSHLASQHRKVIDAIVRCRTATLGGHLDRCSGCGHQAISYNSCRNRHCPKCQSNARARWLAARSAELLPVPTGNATSTNSRPASRFCRCGQSASSKDSGSTPRTWDIAAVHCAVRRPSDRERPRPASGSPSALKDWQPRSRALLCSWVGSSGCVFAEAN